jgi:hypothetical protein
LTNIIQNDKLCKIKNKGKQKCTRAKKKNQVNKIKLGKVSFACYLPHIEKPLKEKNLLAGVLTFGGFF